ncbi:hypothetical protein [Streptomyces sp. NPDC051561]|uniref:hypothetical protein n=1 Tax=Streptomyces sp. NPDC051561 TaxID=3365658 RepID=UPI0037B84341
MPHRTPPPRTMRPPTPAGAALVLGAAVLLAGGQEPAPAPPVAAPTTTPVSYTAGAGASYPYLPGSAFDVRTASWAPTNPLRIALEPAANTALVRPDTTASYPPADAGGTRILTVLRCLVPLHQPTSTPDRKQLTA